MKLKKHLILAILILFGSITAFSQNTHWKSKIQELEVQDGKIFRREIIQFYDSLDMIRNYQERMNAAHAAFNLSSEKDELAHIHSLLYRATHSIPPQVSLFDQAFELAEKHNDIDEICKVEYVRGGYYIARKQFDSAVVHILIYKDLTPAEISCDGYQNILEILGDVYYHAGLYEQATVLYTQIYEYYKVEDNWNFYRPYVMMNNLGQISLKTGNVNEAKSWFRKSLEKADEHLHQLYRDNTLAYIRIKLAEAALREVNLDEAHRELEVAKAFPAANIQNDVKQEWAFHSAILLLKQNQAEEASQVAQQLIPSDTLPGITYRFVPEIYRLLAELASHQGDDSLAVKYYQQFNQAEDSLRQRENLSRSMIILAERENEITKKALKASDQRIKMLAVGLTLLFLILGVILLLYRKLYHSKLQLVRRSLTDSAAVEEYKTSNTKRITETPLENNVEIQQQRELIKQLKDLMEKEKPFLDSGITIKQMSVLLSTNRTYLSRAINNQLNTNFPNLINEYRIKESIRLITKGYTSDHTQEALARKSGFAGRNVFSNAFKKQTGVLPSFFIANYHKLNKKSFQHNISFLDQLS